MYDAGATPRRRLGGKLDRIGLSGTHWVVNDPAGKPPVSRRPATPDHRAEVRLKQMVQDKVIVHKQCIDEHGQDLPEIRNWKWSNPK